MAEREIMRLTPIQPNFSSGELAPRMHARVDVASFKSGLQTCENFIVLPAGGITRRTGSRFVAEAKYDDIPCRLLPFEFSQDQSYAIEFGDGYFHFFTLEGRIHDTVNQVANGTFVSGVSGWTDLCGAGASMSWDSAAQNLTLTADGSNYAWACLSQAISRVDQDHWLSMVVETGGGPMGFAVGASAGASNIFTHTVLTSGINSFRFRPSASTVYLNFYHNVSAAWAIDDVAVYLDYYEISSPYGYGDLSTLQYAQTADAMYLVHQSYAPQKLLRHGDANWTISTVDWEDGPYLDPIVSSLVTPSALSGATTLTGSQGYFSNADAVSGGCLHFRNPNGSTFWYRVSAVTTSTTCSGWLMGPDNLPNLNAGEVRLPAWSVAEGWPTCIDFYEQRLVAGATPEEPQYIWASESGNFESFHPGDNDSDSVYFRPATSKMNAILWLLGASHLLFGTTGAEFSAQGGSDAILTPGDVAVKRRTGIGSAAIQAQLLDQGVVHVQRHGKKVRELLYDYDTYSYTSTDLTLFSEHITGDGVVAFDTTFQPYPILWFVRSDGQLCACTYSRDIGVVAWHRHVTDGEYESLATISGNGRDEVWVVVKREVDGTVKRMIEVFTAEPETLEDSFYVDCGLTYDGAATTRVTGLHHLIGEEVAILADGAVHPPQTVAADGTLTLTLAAEKVHAGLPYTATMETLRINPGAPEGDSLSRRRRISQVDIDFYRTVNAVVYANTGSRLVRAPFRTVGDTMGQAIPWFTGIKDIKPQGEWNNEGTVKVVQDEPLPMTIRALVPRIEIGDA